MLAFDLKEISYTCYYQNLINIKLRSRREFHKQKQTKSPSHLSGHSVCIHTPQSSPVHWIQSCVMFQVSGSSSSPHRPKQAAHSFDEISHLWSPTSLLPVFFLFGFDPKPEVPELPPSKCLVVFTVPFFLAFSFHHSTSFLALSSFFLPLAFTVLSLASFISSILALLTFLHFQNMVRFNVVGILAPLTVLAFLWPEGIGIGRY